MKEELDMMWRFLTTELQDKGELYEATLGALYAIEEGFTEHASIDQLSTDLRDLSRELRMANERLS